MPNMNSTNIYNSFVGKEKKEKRSNISETSPSKPHASNGLEPITNETFVLCLKMISEDRRLDKVTTLKN